MLIARLEIVGREERRAAPRQRLDMASTLVRADPLDRAEPAEAEEPDPVPAREDVVSGTAVSVIVEDFSRSGFRFVSDSDFAVGMTVSIGLAGPGARRATIVREEYGIYGCRFHEPLPEEAMERAFTGQRARVADLAAELARRGMVGPPPVPVPLPVMDAAQVRPRGGAGWLARLRSCLFRRV